MNIRKAILALAALSAASADVGQAQEPAKPALAHRWIYLSTNMLVDKNVEDAVALLRRTAEAGYTGVVLTDSKFMRWDQLPQRYLQNVQRVRKAFRDLHLDCIAAVCPIGYSEGILSRDPNLAAGLPVRRAPLMAKDGKLIPVDDSARIVNGGFEQHKNHRPTAGSSSISRARSPSSTRK